MAKNKTAVIKNGVSEQNELYEKNREELQTLAQESQDIVSEISSVFPFQLFPDKIVVDKNKVSVIRNGFLFSRTFPILIEDIQTVRVTRGLLFASLEFEVMNFEENPLPITHLLPKDAVRVEQYILGLVKASRKKVDLSVLPIKETRRDLELIGKTQV